MVGRNLLELEGATFVHMGLAAEEGGMFVHMELAAEEEPAVEEDTAGRQSELVGIRPGQEDTQCIQVEELATFVGRKERVGQA